MSEKVSKAQQQAVQRYVKKNYDRVVLTLPKGRREDVRAYADSLDMSLNGFIVAAIEEKISKAVEE